MKKPSVLFLPILLVSAHREGWDAVVAAIDSHESTIVLNTSINATSFVTIQNPLALFGQGHAMHFLNMSLLADVNIENLHVNGHVAVLTGTLTMRNCNVSGEGLSVESEAVLDRCTFLQNRGTDMGGGFYVRQGKLSMVDCLFTLNYAGGGSAGYVTGGELQVERTTFLSNQAFVGTVWIDASIARFEDCSFECNTNQAFGGGLFVGGRSQVTLTRCLFTSNIGGGALYAVEGSSITLDQCNFTSNIAAIHDLVSTTRSQALYLRHTTAYVYESIFVNNTAFLDRGTSYYSYASTSIDDWSVQNAQQVATCNQHIHEDDCAWMTTTPTLLPATSTWIVLFHTVQPVNEEIADVYEKAIERMLSTNATLVDYDINLVKLRVDFTSIDVEHELNNALENGDLVFGGVRTSSVDARVAPTPKPESSNTGSSSSQSNIPMLLVAIPIFLVVVILACTCCLRRCKSSLQRDSMDHSSPKEVAVGSPPKRNEATVDDDDDVSARRKTEKDNVDNSIHLDMPDTIEVSDDDDDSQHDEAPFTPKSPRSLSSSRRTLGSPMSNTSPSRFESDGSSSSSGDDSDESPIHTRRTTTWLRSPKPSIRRSSTSEVTTTPPRSSPRRSSTSGETTPSRLRRMLTPRRSGSEQESESFRGLIRRDDAVDDEEEAAVHSPLVERRRRRRRRGLSQSRVVEGVAHFPSDSGEDSSSPVSSSSESP